MLNDLILTFNDAGLQSVKELLETDAYNKYERCRKISDLFRNFHTKESRDKLNIFIGKLISFFKVYSRYLETNIIYSYSLFTA